MYQLNRAELVGVKNMQFCFGLQVEDVSYFPGAPCGDAAAPDDGLTVPRGMVAIHWTDTGCAATLLP